MNRVADRTLPGAEHTLFGGYGPFVALVALLLAMALLAPTVAPERVVTTRSTVSGDRRSSLTPPVSEERRSPETVERVVTTRSGATVGASSAMARSSATRATNGP